jgi:Leucine-rich repeat (LRR) protein
MTGIIKVEALSNCRASNVADSSIERRICLSDPFREELDGRMYPKSCIDDGTGTEQYDFSMLCYLRELKVVRSICTTLSALGSMRKLRKLDLGGCGLGNDKLSTLSLPASILSLDLSGNLLERLPDLSHLLDLEALNVSHNAIKKFVPPFISKSLMKVDLSHNELSGSLNFTPFRILEDIDLSYNQLDSLPVLPDLLLTLSISSNRITSLSTSAYMRLEHLNISANPVDGGILFESIMTGFPHLRTLSVPITDIRDKRRFLGFRSLQFLNDEPISKAEKAKYVYGF